MVAFALSHTLSPASHTSFHLLIINERSPMGFSLGSTTDLIWRWRDISDEDGERCGHSLRWYALVVLWGGLHVTGDDCADMEEHLISTFKKAQYDRGRCQNIALKSLRVVRSAVGPHWVYMCIPQGVPRRPS